MSKKEEAEFEEYESLKNSKFKQQKLPGWRPVPSMARTITIFIILGIVFAGLGVLILLFSNQIVEVIKRYDDICNNTQICPITFKIEKKMVKDIFIYYRIDGFYQNHRRYVKSKSDDQLNGKHITKEEMIDSQDCDPAITNKQMNKNKSILGNDLNETDLAVPCGLIAKSYFNDNFTNWTYIDRHGDIIPIKPNEKNIAWKADKELKYKNSNDLSKQWIDMTDEHFIVWMRPAGLPNFRKLWGRIDDRDLDENTQLFVNIDDQFDVSSFNGKKYIILSTVNAFGGKNSFLGISYIVLGGISIILAIVFIIGYNVHTKKNK